MSSQTHAYAYLTQPEVRFLDAAASRLIPADELGPGAKEAGVTVFIDKQLMSTWGTHGRNYRGGPWLEGTPQQGFQSRLTPQEIYRAGIRETDLYCTERYGKVFAFLTGDQQDEVLHALQEGAVELESLSSKLFFGTLWRNTEEGYFSDPMYGGNQDKAGWRLVGFPGVAASNYTEHMAKPPESYRVEPVSIVDIANGTAQTDSQGYPRHVRTNEKKGA
jgi:gluconate 2-dehydrogenase gamma chain